MLPFIRGSTDASVCRSSDGSMAFTNVLLPTPLCPTNNETLPCRSAFTASMPLFFSAEVIDVR